MADHGIDISLRLRQRVYFYIGTRKIFGKVEGLNFGRDGDVEIEVLLDDAAEGAGGEEFSRILPVAEVFPFDDRDEQIADLLAALRKAQAGLMEARGFIENDELLHEMDIAIAKAAGSAS